ncbi:MAG: hypothetical protein GY862_29210 [Gammaproteobacteria bacterium]|nr:hypothetical protein [Gammaproteobacteria bacterium]
MPDGFSRLEHEPHLQEKLNFPRANLPATKAALPNIANLKPNVGKPVIIGMKFLQR